MSVTLVNNSPQLTVATAGTRGLTGAHVASAEFSGSDLIITLSDGTVVNAGGAVLSSSGSNNWVGQQAINGNVIVTGSFILSGSNTLINIGPTSLSGSVNISGSTTITGSLIVSGGTINVLGTNLISSSTGITLANTTGYSTFSSSLSQSISHSVSNLSSSIGSLSGSVSTLVDSKIAGVNIHLYLSKSVYNSNVTESTLKIAALEVSSSIITTKFNSLYTSSTDKVANLEVSASNALNLNTSQTNRISNLEIFTGSVDVIIDDLIISSSINRANAIALFSSSASFQTFNENVVGGLLATSSNLILSASSLKLSASNHENRIDAIEYSSSQWGASTDIGALNTFTASALISFSALQTTASALVAYTTSSDSDINKLEVSASSLILSASSLRTSASTALSTNNSQASSITALNTFSASVNASSSIVNTFTSSVNTFTASVNTSLDSLTTISASLLVSASSLKVSASSLVSSASTALSTNNSQTAIVNDIRAYTSSLKTAIDISDGHLTVLGNLVVQGTQTTLDSSNLRIADKLLEIASGSTTSGQANGSGIYISGADAYISWSSANNRLEINKNVYIGGNINLGGNVDGTDILALSSSFHTTSGSYNNVSGAINTIINGLNDYTSSSGIKISNLNTISASYLTFTQSYYTNSSSFDERVADLEASVGGGGTGIATRVSTLETSASLSAATNSIQSNTISGITTQISLLIQTSSNLAGGAVGTTNQLNALNASSSAVFSSASGFKNDISSINLRNNLQDANISSLFVYTSSINQYTESISASISNLTSSISSGSFILTKIARLESITQSLLDFTSSFYTGTTSTGSRINKLESSASIAAINIGILSLSTGSTTTFLTTTFPAYTSSIELRLSASEAFSSSLNAGFATDGELVAATISSSNSINQLSLTGSALSSSVFNTSNGLSRSINLKIQDVSGSITSRINELVIGTGFVEKSVFNAVTSSLNTVTASLFLSASALASSASTALTTNNLQTQSINNLNSYTSSLKTALQPNGSDVNVSGDLYVSGNIVAEQYIVSTSVYYVTESNFEGNHIFGDQYGDTQVLNGITTINGALILNVSSSDPVSNPSFVSISADIRVVSGNVIAPIFKGTFDGAYSSSIQTNVSGTTGFNNFISAISESVNTATSSLSSSISSSINLLSASVAALNAAQVFTSSLTEITNSLYNTTQSLNNSTQSLNTFSASVIATGSIINTFTSSVNSFTASVIATGSVINTFTSSVNNSTSSLNSYTSSLKAAMQVNGSDLNVSGNVYVSGNIVAQNYIVSSSVTYMTTSFSSGSTVFGNDSSDTHRLTGSVYVTGAFKLNDVSSELSIVGNGFGQTSLISPNGALVLTPGLYGVQINGANPDLQVNGNITANGYISGAIRATNNVVSSSAQFVDYGALLTSSVSGKQAVSGTLIVSGTTSITGSTNVDLRGVPSGNFTIQNGATRIDSILFVSDNDYVSNAYVGGDIRVNDYLAGGYTAHYDGGVQITGSLRVNAGQNGSGSYFTGSVWITGNEAVSGNLQVVGNTSVSGNFTSNTISSSTYVSASGLQIANNARINGFTDLRNGLEVRGNGVNDEARFYVTSLRAEGNVAISGGLEVLDQTSVLKNVKITDLSANGIPYSVDDSGSLQDSANFTYNGVTFNIGAGKFTVDVTTGDVATQGTLKVDGATTLHSTLNVTGSVGIASSLTVTGSTTISSSLRVTNTASFAHLNVTGSTNVTGSVSIGGALAVSGSSRVSGNLAVSGTLDVSGSATFDSMVNITGALAVTGGFSVKGEPVLIGDSMTDSIIISGGLDITGSYSRNTTNLKATGSNNPADGIYRLTQAQAWSASFTTGSGELKTPDEFFEVFFGQGSNKKRYIVPAWLDETLYADDYFDISFTTGSDAEYVY